MKKKGRLTIEGMIQSLNNGQLASFMAQMMVFLEAGLPAIKDMLADASAQMMIALCRVNRVEKKCF
jgi:hypothetical protein